MRGQTLEQFTSESLNPNDLRHFKAIFKEISAQPLENVLTYLRDKTAVTQMGIQKAMCQINQYIVQRANDDACTDMLVALITNRVDAEILVDAFYFSEKRPLTFVSLDSTDVVKNRNQIIRAIRNCRLLENTYVLSLGIQYLGEIV
ncbi:MAG: hypothetical protein FWH37_02970 [Candidatus Bathyarchaeota archaeon]|nr:hypothetical protein [Candidatus Termiticorpusculum sp.]